MKQILEEAAREELISSYAIVVEGELAYQKQAMLNMFRKGAEWHAKQSPWISVEERKIQIFVNCMNLNASMTKIMFNINKKGIK
jgi:hypothetical protein